MANTFISCVGMRDPFDSESPQWYGAALACIVSKKPQNVVLLTTARTSEKGQLLERLIQGIDQNIQVKKIDTEIADPSNFAEVDLRLRKCLREIAQSEKDVLVNISSGTPQMTMCLGILLATEFLNGVAVKVSAPEFNAGSSGSVDTKSNAGLPKESIEDVNLRIKVLHDLEMPVIEHITRSNALSLCKRFDYSGACELLEVSKRAKTYRKFVIPVLQLAENLLLLRFGDAKNNHATLTADGAQHYSAQLERLSQGLSFHPATIFYRATEIRNKTGRIDEFFRCAGLTREACLAYYTALPSVRRHYEQSVANAEESPVRIDLKQLQENNPSLHAYLKETLKPLYEPFKLMAGTMLPLVSFAAIEDLELVQIAEILRATGDLAGLRNTYAHTLQESKKDDRKKAESLFKKLGVALPEGQLESLRQCDPFLICTEIVTDYLQYFDR